MASDRKIIINCERTQYHSTTIYKLYADSKTRPKEDYPYAVRFICGQPVPGFQRELCWTEDMNISFIESIWYGYDIGSYMVATYNIDGSGGLAKYSDALIDGQQRLMALDRYWNNEFKVLGYYWSDLTLADTRGFNNKGFGHHEIMSINESVLKKTYNRLNFSGVQHSIKDKA